jgi:sugar phosphate isomerase/epimerase
MIGVSPAFVFSLYGTGFSAQDFCAALPRIQRLGFSAYQPEIYHAAAIPEWTRHAQQVDATAADLGLNFDSGHAWACRKLVPALPFELAGRVFGTHLGDNCSTENVKLPPGKGTIPWAPLLRNLRAAGYTGSLDIEIGCPAAEVEDQYRAGLEFLRSLPIGPPGDHP